MRERCVNKPSRILLSHSKCNGPRAPLYFDMFGSRAGWFEYRMPR